MHAVTPSFSWTSPTSRLLCFLPSSSFTKGQPSGTISLKMTAAGGGLVDLAVARGP